MTTRPAMVLLGLAAGAATWTSSLAQAPAGRPVSAPRPLAAISVPPPAAATTVPPSYSGRGRRDPFQPLETGQGVGLTVASARLRGILRGGATRALLETPDGVGYIMKPGDTLGDGRLLEIGTDSVVFRVPPRRGSTTDLVVLRLSSD